MKKLFLFILLFIATPVLHGQSGFLHRQGKTIVDASGQPVSLRGVDLGGWLDWEGWIYGGGFIGETDILNNLSKIVGQTKAQQFHNDVYQNFISKRDIEAISQSCLNVVRVAFNHILLEDDSAPFVYKQSGWNILDSTLKWCEQYNVYAVIDMHAAPGGQSNLFMADPDKDTMLWGSDFKKARTVALWKAIAIRYKDRNIIAGYDLLNEPSPPWFGESQLVDIYNKIIQTIRTVDNNHMVILEGTNYAKDFWMFSSLPDPNMSFSFHLYTSTSNDTKTNTQNFKSIADSKNVPMWCGEWGENKAAVLDTTRQIFEDPANEISGWCFWTWKEFNNSGDYFNIIQPSATWKKLISWVTDSSWYNPKPTYAEAIQGMADFIYAVKYDNTVKGPLVPILNVCNSVTAVTNNSSSNSNLITIFPSPATDILNVSISDNVDKIYYSVYDLIGNKIYNGIIMDNTTQIDISDFSSGMYFLKLSDGKTESTQKFLVKK